jgi:hypothetical protein
MTVYLLFVFYYAPCFLFEVLFLCSFKGIYNFLCFFATVCENDQYCFLVFQICVVVFALS